MHDVNMQNSHKQRETGEGNQLELPRLEQVFPVARESDAIHQTVCQSPVELLD